MKVLARAVLAAGLSSGIFAAGYWLGGRSATDEFIEQGILSVIGSNLEDAEIKKTMENWKR